MKRVLLLIVAAVVATGCARPNEILEIEFYPSPHTTDVYAPAVRVGHLLFLSGQIGTDSAGKLVAGGIEAEGRQALNNLQRAVEQYGSRMDRVANCLVMLTDMNDYAPFNAIYASYFRVRHPARSAMAVSGLALGARVEVKCMAVVE
jgi:reactive intermediate/imine deaminase